MYEEITISIGAINISIRYSKISSYRLGRYTKFLSNGKAHVKLNLHLSELPDLADSRQVFDNGVGARILKVGGKNAITIGSEEQGLVQVGLNVF